MTFQRKDPSGASFSSKESDPRFSQLIRWLTDLSSILHDAGISRNEKEEIDRILNAIEQIRDGHLKVYRTQDIRVSQAYFRYLRFLGEAQDQFKWQKERKSGLSVENFISDPKNNEMRVWIEGNAERGIEQRIPFDQSLESLREKAEHVLGRKNPSELAIEFTARDFQLSEEQVRKKIRRIASQ
jgi:hypothetical protein